MFGTLSDADVDDFMASVDGFESATGIDVRYVGSSNFEADLLERLRRGDPPDLALLPQPGLLDTLVEDGFALPWTGELAEPAVEGVPDELVDLVGFGGRRLRRVVPADVEEPRLVLAEGVRRRAAWRCRPRGTSSPR